jgi:RimJ/RimL family protein N-acetyltransferase
MTLLRDDTSIETDRLLLRRITTGDLPFFTRIHADADVSRYIGYGKPRTPDESRRWLEAVLATYEAHQLGQLAVTRKSDGELLGRCGLSFVEVDAAPADGGDPVCYFLLGEAPAGRPTAVQPELGYTFDKAVWRQGFAREAARAVFDYGVGRRGLERVTSLIRADNARSIHLVESFGATRSGCVRAFGGLSFDRFVWPGFLPK